MLKSSSPGKLYIAGEYAVVEKGYPAIIIAVDQFISVSLKETAFKGSIQAYDNSPITFKRVEERLVLDYRDNRLSYVINSINVVEKLAQQLNKDLLFYDLSVESDLENIEGKKYGLGSSAAVTVSTIAVLCKLYDIELSKLSLFKLAAIVHYNINSNGSGGDLAASIYGGWIAFTTFDKDWLKHQIEQTSISELINMDWPYLSIKELIAPKDLKLLIGWTGSPASTTVLVDKVSESRNANAKFYQEFLEESQKCVNLMIKGFQENDTDKIMEQISVNRKLLQNLGDKLQVEIETVKLAKLSNIAQDFKGAAKSSGAGGGDCGIAIFKNDYDENSVKDKWRQAGIIDLDLKVFKRSRQDAQ